MASAPSIDAPLRGALAPPARRQLNVDGHQQQEKEEEEKEEEKEEEAQDGDGDDRAEGSRLTRGGVKQKKKGRPRPEERGIADGHPGGAFDGFPPRPGPCLACGVEQQTEVADRAGPEESPRRREDRPRQQGWQDQQIQEVRGRQDIERQVEHETERERERESRRSNKEGSAAVPGAQGGPSADLWRSPQSRTKRGRR
ncbi:unnamed protein product [Prorocentrum cordatum]|uniref:Uncharacterized protein n=1 Tax=Prorocentrum cordatum TaxID=2364126 RepID=A0ABN9RE00_9DINO|nr:unnamed protein product [Polarella glacialis]